jgi:hypothetical protein
MQVVKAFGELLLLAWLALGFPATAQACDPGPIKFYAGVIATGITGESTLGTPCPTKQAPTYHIQGAVDLIPGHPATAEVITSGMVTILSSPRAARTREESHFEIWAVEPFGGCLPARAEVVVAGTNERITRDFPICAAGQFDSWEEESDLTDFLIALPPVVMSRPSTITGSFPGVNATVANDVYVAIDSLGIAVPISASGTFIIPGVPPGLHRIELRPFNANTTTIRGTAWMNAPVWAGLQSNHVGPTVAVTRLAISPSTATTPTTTSTSSTTSSPIVSR